MTAERPSDRFAQANREKGLVAASSLAAALVLTSLKFAIGLLTGSLGILAEAAHSLLDMVAAAVTLWAVRAAAKPADRAHTYGHGKVENLSALFETFLLLVTCVWIIYEAVARLFFRAKVEIDPSLWAFLVVILSIVVDFSRSRALRRAAEKYSSQALEADALHFSTDIWSSLVVLLGLFGVLLAKGLGPSWSWLQQADTAAALTVAAIVIWVSVRLGKKSIDDLLDSVPQDLLDKVKGAAAGVPGVADVRQVRVRRSGPEVFADLTVAVSRQTGLESAHALASRAEEAVRAVLPHVGVDVVVHVEPVEPADEELVTKVRVLAARFGLGAHGVRIYQEGGRQAMELHLEVEQSLSLDEAHRQADAFEQSVRQAIPALQRIVTHIEPAGEQASTVEAGPAMVERVRRATAEFLRRKRLPADPHDFRVQFAEGELAVSFHCSLDATMAITDAHELTQEMESHLRRRFPHLGRVVIHVEPDR